jgi:hypothetical protein
MSYNTNAVTSRITVQNSAKLAAGSYKSGQLLGRLTASGIYTALTAIPTSDATGSEIPRAVCVYDVDIPNGGGAAAIAKGEFILEGVKAATPVTIVPIQLGQCFDAGIILN